MRKPTQQQATCTKDHSYNGWSNYETWAVKLWMDNEQGTCDSWRETTKEIWEESAENLPEYFTHEENAVYNLAARLKAELEEGAPDLGASVYADLLSAAMSEVNWREIAQSLISDLKENA